jgi:hypothetical protein
MYWMASSNEKDAREKGFKWADRVTFGDAPVNRNCAVLYEQWYAQDVKDRGLSITQTDAAYWGRFDAAIRTALDKYAPGADYSGLILLDTEFLPLFWGDRTGGPGIYPVSDYGRKPFDAWFAHIRDHRPEVIRGKNPKASEDALRESYESAVREWHEHQYATARQLRSHARFCRYGLPAGSRHGQYSQGDPNPWKQLNDRAAWLTQLQDVVLVVLYQDKYTVAAGKQPRNSREMTQDQARDWIVSNLAEAKRTAMGKPVYALAYLRYQEFVTGHESKLLEGPALDCMLTLPRQAGASGLVIWDHIDSQSQFQETQSFINSSCIEKLSPGKKVSPQ